MKAIDLTGQRFGRLVVVSRAEDKETKKKEIKQHSKFWVCQCDCGNTIIVSTIHLKDGHTKSCGCWHDENSKTVGRTHGMAHTRLHGVWNSMLRRCYNPKNLKYKNYGARGITVCEEWKQFINFYKWAMATGYDKNAEYGECTIDRIDVNGNYCPENCRWTTNYEQMRNMTNNHWITYQGETHILADWVKILGEKGKTFKNRIDRGWTVEEAMEIPYNKNRIKRGK